MKNSPPTAPIGTSHIVISRDGTKIGYLSVGDGPSVLVIPGVLSMAADYAAFARALSEHFAVHTIERRGRGESGPQGDDYSIVKECEDVLALQARTREVRVDAAIADYILDLIDATRAHPEVALAASTRAALGLYRAVQAHAVTDGRDYAIPDDVKALAEPVLAHRLVTRSWAQGGHPDASPVVREILGQLKVPT